MINLCVSTWFSSIDAKAFPDGKVCKMFILLKTKDKVGLFISAAEQLEKKNF